MTLQSSGPISLGNVALELGRASTTTTSLGEAAVRTLAGVASGPISLSNLYGKSNESFWYATFGSTVVNFLILGTDSSGNIYASASSAVFKWDRDGALIWARNVSGPFINGGWIDANERGRELLRRAETNAPGRPRTQQLLKEALELQDKNARALFEQALAAQVTGAEEAKHHALHITLNGRLWQARAVACSGTVQRWHLQLQGPECVELWLTDQSHSAPSTGASAQAAQSLRAPFNGKLIALHVQEGQQVKQGDLLFELDPADYQLKVEFSLCIHL